MPVRAGGGFYRKLARLIQALTDALAVTGDFLLGREAPAPKRTGGPVGKAKQVFEAVSKLPRDQQRDILRTVEDLIAARALRKTA